MKCWMMGILISLPHMFFLFLIGISSLVLNTEAAEIAPRVTMSKQMEDLPISEQTITQALQAAKEQFTKSLRNINK